MKNLAMKCEEGPSSPDMFLNLYKSDWKHYLKARTCKTKDGKFQDLKTGGLCRMRTRVVSLRHESCSGPTDTGRVPQAEGISSLVLLYYLSNASYAKCNKLRYDVPLGADLRQLAQDPLGAGHEQYIIP
ncbi:hypothetical protein LXL04_009958 [Taraxacum kok-saghyz]